MTNSAGSTWRKSSHSGGQGGECIEVASTAWRKSTYSTGQGGECVEVADGLDVIPVRDSKDPHGPALTFYPAAWTAFIDDVKAGRYPSAE
jgi:hypothetical protein